MKNQDSEKRKNRRFRVEGRAFIILSPSHTRVGRIIDISSGGLGFWYLQGRPPSEETSELAIYVDDYQYLEAVPCKVVYNTEMTDDSPANPMAKQKMGIQFGKLTLSQISRLEDFIRLHTTEVEAEDDSF